jgi:predicted ArsR family transcriptional regulator
VTAAASHTVPVLGVLSTTQAWPFQRITSGDTGCLADGVHLGGRARSHRRAAWAADVAATRGGGSGDTDGAADVRSLLQDRGYEPYDDDGRIRLRNCPFGALVERHRELVCRTNLALVEGLLEGLRRSDLRAILDPAPERCCVALV